MTSGPAIFACAPMQAGLVYETLGGRPGAYAQQVTITCREALDAEALGRAWGVLVGRHPALRTSFVIGGSAPVRQRVEADVAAGAVIVDWRDLPEPDRELRWSELLSADRDQGFDPGTAPLTRVAICRMTRTETRMLWTYHHAILDGRSRLTLLRELFDLYAQEASGGRLEEWRPPPEFARFAGWAAAAGGDAATEEFWREVLTGIEEPTPAPGSGWAGARSDPRAPGGAGTISGPLEAGVSRAVREVASARGLTPATVLQGAYGLLLAQESDRDDVLFASTRAGRWGAPFETREMIGLLMVTSAVRMRVDAAARVGEWLAGVRAFNLSVRPFEHAALSDLRRWSAIPRPEPLAESLFSYENGSMNALLRAADPSWEPREVRLIEQLEFPLTLEVLGDEEILVKVLYDGVRVPGQEAVRVLERYRALVRAVAERPDGSVGAAGELSPRRRRELSGEADVVPPPGAGDLAPARVDEQIRRHPERVAVEHARRQVTYGELGARTAELAGQLIERGAGRGSIVGVAMERTPDLVCALLAVHRVGAAYLPLDPRHPARRLGFMIADSRAGVVVTDVASRPRLPERVEAAVLVADGPPEPVGERPAAGRVGPDDLSHVIYTSGSTGAPKAVMIEHRSVAQLTTWAEGTFGAEERDGMLASTSIGFDLSVFEIQVTLALGGRVVLVEDLLALSDPDFSPAIGFVNGVPTAVGELVRAVDLPASVRTVGLAGEAVPTWLVERLYAGPSIEGVWNLYGPTEDTTYSTSHRCVPGERPPIGRPLPGTQAYVVDRHLRPVPEGVAGELLLGGRGLARGYLGRPELTAASFVEVRFDDGGGGRVYRTGDRARWAAGGRLDFLGRADDQVKIRGVRVEPAEVAYALRGLDGVEDAVVLATGEGPERGLVAYVVAEGGRPAGASELRDRLAACLPGALVPRAIVIVDRLPRTASGKLDRRALAATPGGAGRGGSRVAASASGRVESAKGTEAALGELWRELLDLPGPVVGTDDFFLVGGDSLKALRLLGEIEDRFGRRLPVGRLLNATTLAEQARAIETAGEAGEAPGADVLVPVRRTGSRRPWICVVTDRRGVIGLRNLLGALPVDQPVYAIQAIDPPTRSWRGMSVGTIAAACLAAVRDRLPEGPYRLGGHSVGGLVAYEMACGLVGAGEEVELLLLLDTMAPEAGRWRARAASRDRVLRRDSVADRVRGQAGIIRWAVEDTISLALGERRVGGRPVGFVDRFDRAGASRLIRGYRPPRLEAPVTVFHTAVSRTAMGGPDLGWGRHIGGEVTTRELPGDHMSIFSEPQVRALGWAISGELGRARPQE